MKIEITDQQIGVEVPGWYRVHTPCPKCGLQDIPWTITRYGQSSTLKSDQTMTGMTLGGAGAGLHTNRWTLKCRCGFEAEPDDPTPDELREARFKVKAEKIVVAGSNFKVPGDYKKHDRILRFPNLSAGRKENKIDLYHKG